MTWPLTVPVESCCGVIVGEEHDCWTFQAQAYAAFSNPILLPAHADLPALTDPALNVWRPGGDMVQAMCPPQRWQVTAEGVSVHLGAS